MEGCVRGKASVFTRVTYVFVMSRVVKQEVPEFIILHEMKNCIILGESLQYFLEFFGMHKTKIPLADVTKDVR